MKMPEPEDIEFCSTPGVSRIYAYAFARGLIADLSRMYGMLGAGQQCTAETPRSAQYPETASASAECDVDVVQRQPWYSAELVRSSRPLL